jgi:hypothetical protein
MRKDIPIHIIITDDEINVYIEINRVEQMIAPIKLENYSKSDLNRIVYEHLKNDDEMDYENDTILIENYLAEIDDKIQKNI